MKPLSRLLFLFLLGLAAWPLLTAADPPAPAEKAVAIPKAEQPIKIDGVLDDPAWKDAPVVTADYIWSKVGEKSPTPRMKVRYTWDDNYLYIGYETFDKNLTAIGTGEKKAPKDNQREGCVIGRDKADVVEFFISFGDTRFFWEVHHNASNQMNNIWCVVVDDNWPIAKSTINRFGIQFHTNEFIQDDEAAGHKLAMAVHLKPKADGKPSTVNDPSDEDTGYTAEIRLPWAGLGADEGRIARAGEDRRRQDEERAWPVEDGGPGDDDPRGSAGRRREGERRLLPLQSDEARRLVPQGNASLPTLHSGSEEVNSPFRLRLRRSRGIAWSGERRGLSPPGQARRLTGPAIFERLP